MSFVTALALLVGVLVVAPYLAHRLRRRRADDRPFAAAHLVPPAPPRARRRARLEDHALFATRALAVLALALLGASPLVRCSRLALERSSGASVALAIVVDDSMSMRAAVDGRAAGQGGTSRFERAREGARQLLGSAREGDAVALVLAGAPPRVALAATTDLSAARAALDAVTPSDRATDLDAAVTMARALIAQLPQVDKRVVLFSDLEDGSPEAPALGEGSAVPVWVPLPELRDGAGAVKDCAVTSADRAGTRVRVHVACSHAIEAAGAAPAGREVVVSDGDKVIAKSALPSTPSGDVAVTLPTEPEPGTRLVARLSGPPDAIAEDDAAPVVTEAGPGAIAVVADASEAPQATGGAPVVEQALSALKSGVAVRPLPVLPDRVEDLGAFVGIIVDDPPGFTPEQRHALAAYLGDGGLLLLALGARAAVAPLGATFEPVLEHPVSFDTNDTTGDPGADPASARGELTEAATTLDDLGASRRTLLAPEDTSALEVLVAWRDRRPLVARRALGRGEAWIVTLPFNVDASDLPLRPGFLSLLDAWVDKARLRASPRRGEVGVPWVFAGGGVVSVTGPGGAVQVQRESGAARVEPSVLGTYEVKLTGNKTEVRVAAPALREIDMRPRAVASTAAGKGLGDTHASVDVSWVIALVLLGLVAIELALRVRAAAAPATPEQPAGGAAAPDAASVAQGESNEAA